MAEYIDKMKVLNKLRGRKTIELVMDIEPADVIELKPILEEYENLIQTNPTSKAVDEFCIKTMRKILCDYFVEKI